MIESIKKVVKKENIRILKKHTSKRFANSK